MHLTHIKDNQDFKTDVITFLINLDKNHQTLIVHAKIFQLQTNLNLVQQNAVNVKMQNEYNLFDFALIKFFK